MSQNETASVTCSDMLHSVADQDEMGTEIYVRMHNSDLIPVSKILQEEADGTPVIVLEV